MHEARDEGGYRRIEVITGRRKRRDWSDEEKAGLFVRAQNLSKPTVRAVLRA